MNLLQYIIQRNAEKFANDTREDLWAYRRFLEKQEGEEVKKTLASVNQALGIKEDKVELAEPKPSKEDKLIVREGIKAIKRHFNV